MAVVSLSFSSCCFLTCIVLVPFVCESSMIDFKCFVRTKSHFDTDNLNDLSGYINRRVIMLLTISILRKHSTLIALANVKSMTHSSSPNQNTNNQMGMFI